MTGIKHSQLERISCSSLAAALETILQDFACDSPGMDIREGTGLLKCFVVSEFYCRILGAFRALHWGRITLDVTAYVLLHLLLFFLPFPYRTFRNTRSTCRTPRTRSANLRTSVCTAQHTESAVWVTRTSILNVKLTMDRKGRLNTILDLLNTAATNLNKKEIIRNLLYRGWHLCFVCKRYWIQILVRVSTILTKFFFMIFLLPTRHMPD